MHETREKIPSGCPVHVTLKVRGQANGEEVLSDDNLPYEVGSKYFGGLITNDLDEPLDLTAAKHVWTRSKLKGVAIPPGADTYEKGRPN